MKKKSWILYLAVAIALVALVLYARHRIHFNWTVFVQQLKLADWPMMALGASFILLGYIVRAIRWALFLKPARKVSFPSRPWFDVLAAQIIGYTGVALLGRPADLIRPYLVARRVKLPLSSQIAVYVVERMFDLAAMALIFSTVLFFAPDRATLPHPEQLRHIALVGLIGTAALAILATAVRIGGQAVATSAEKIVGKLSEGLGRSVAEKIITFRDGLDMLGSLRDVFAALMLSLLMWGLITVAYLETIRAFVDSPPLHGLTLARCMVLMAAGMAASAIQLPVVGWFTQIAFLAAAMRELFQAAWEPALGCAAMLLVVTYLIVIPAGLVWAHFDHVSLRKVSAESEHAGVEALTPPEAVSPS
ncbi:MAG TPA: lysylphosphatidylglycerol synthase transmembrane domain-containing protein [Silvibacterium sp.]|nr:lysylphosphatidylglycerol synthase transmembrane domain-containing protein [Silvibacterium sp.]